MSFGRMVQHLEKKRRRVNSKNGYWKLHSLPDRLYENGHNFFVRTPNEVKRSELGSLLIGLSMDILLATQIICVLGDMTLQSRPSKKASLGNFGF